MSTVESETATETAPTSSAWDELLADPLDPQVTSIQPGGGVIVHLEKAWGAFRRVWLRVFRKKYIKRMEDCRLGSVNPAPHAVYDSRDLKYFRNQGGDEAWRWEAKDDPFARRDRIPFARAGLAELLFFSLLFFGGCGSLLTVTLAVPLEGFAAALGWLFAVACAVIGILIVWFFRDPERAIPDEPGNVVSPADGKIVAIEEIEDPHIGPAICIGIFLSIFNVHLNRAPLPGRVVALRYRRGKFLNALKPESVQENEQMTIHMESTENDAPPRRVIVRQIAGALARRIVCWIKPGEQLPRGERVGMIKLGSRTELVIPRDEKVEIVTKLGAKVKAGRDLLAEYK